MTLDETLKQLEALGNEKTRAHNTKLVPGTTPGSESKSSDSRKHHGATGFSELRIP
jgi:hypothetical protein